MRIFLASIAALTAAAMMAAGFWIAGFNFDERGGTAIAAYIATLIAGAYAFGFTMMAAENKPPGR